MIRVLLSAGFLVLLGCSDKGDDGTDTQGVGTTTTDPGTTNPTTTDPGTTTSPDNDADDDGFDADDDCDDSDPAVNPDATEVCDGIDNNCDGDIDEATAADASTWYADADADGFGDTKSSQLSCEQPSGHVDNDTDCDDSDALQNPKASEVCNGEDDDCDGITDEEDAIDATTWYVDADNDGFGDAANTMVSCEQPSGYVANDTDCNDASPLQNPDSDERCNGEDDDCDGTIDEDDAVDAGTWYPDGDNDSFGDANAAGVQACDQPSGYLADNSDCDDNDRMQNPDAPELCNREDDDCDGDIDEDDAVDASTWYIDNDSDGYGDVRFTAEACEQPSGYVGDDTDCDDTDSSQYPGADEYCNSADDDCDGDIDEDAVDGGYYATDDDSDGFGAENTTEWACDGVDNELDCDDSDSTEPVVVDGTNGTAAGLGTINQPLDTIQAGIDVANNCVVVAAGTYAEAIDFGGANISVTSMDGADSTTIDAAGLGSPVVSFTSGETSDATLDGFTLSGGEGYLDEPEPSSTNCYSNYDCYTYISSYCGGGIYINSADPSLLNLSIDGHSLPAASSTTSGYDEYFVYSFGGGVCAVNSVASFNNVDLTDNYADQGGGVYVDEDSTITFEQGILTANNATDGGAFEVDGGTLSLTNVITLWNNADSDGADVLAIGGSVDATNVTLAGGTATSGGGIYAAETSTVQVANSIIANSAVEGVLADSSSTFTGTYNNVYANAGGEYSGTTDPTGSLGNISSDPVFTAWSDDGNATNDDVALRAISPSIDAGNPAVIFNDADGSTNDQGAYGGPNGDWD